MNGNFKTFKTYKSVLKCVRKYASSKKYNFILVDRKSPQLDIISGFLEESNYHHRPDYEIGKAVDLKIYVNGLFNSHHRSLFSKNVFSLSIIPIMKIEDTYKVVVVDRVRPITVNYDYSEIEEKLEDNMKQAVIQRTKEEFRISATRCSFLNILCATSDYFNPCLGDKDTSEGIKRQWKYAVALMPNSRAIRVLKTMSVETFIKNLIDTVKVDDKNLIEEINEVISLIETENA